MEWPAPPSGVVGSPANQEEEGMDISVLGVDLGKNVCNVVGLDASGAVVMRRKVRRETLIALAEKIPPCIVGMEACCEAHHLGRVFAARSHDVRLMSPEYVRPYIKAQKNDDRDAEGIAEATTRPTMLACPSIRRHGLSENPAAGGQRLGWPGRSVSERMG
jgi:transposase